MKLMDFFFAFTEGKEGKGKYVLSFYLENDSMECPGDRSE